MVKNIIHIIPDDKSIDDAIMFFDNIKFLTNKYLCVTDKPTCRWKYIKNEDRVENILYGDLVELLRKTVADLIIFHQLPWYFYSIILQIPRDKKIVWSSWGYDLYEPQGAYPALIDINLYKPITRKYMISKTEPFYRFWRKLRHPRGYLRSLRDAYIKQQQVNNLLKRIDYVATVIPAEYDLLRNRTVFHGKYFPFQYTYAIGSEANSNISNDATMILLGNSATPTNNHLDAIKIINERKICNKVYLPLAYGDEKYKEYIKNVVDNNQFVVMSNYIPRNEYFKQLSVCIVGVFPHLRQQALGNVSYCINSGMKIFLYKESILYKYLKSQNAYIYTIEDDLTQEAVNERLTEEQISINKSIFYNWFNYNVVKRRLEKFLQQELL